MNEIYCFMWCHPEVGYAETREEKMIDKREEQGDVTHRKQVRTVIHKIQVLLVKTSNDSECISFY